MKLPKDRGADLKIYSVHLGAMRLSEFRSLIRLAKPDEQKAYIDGMRFLET